MGPAPYGRAATHALRVACAVSVWFGWARSLRQSVSGALGRSAADDALLLEGARQQDPGETLLRVLLQLARLYGDRFGTEVLLQDTTQISLVDGLRYISAWDGSAIAGAASLETSILF